MPGREQVEDMDIREALERDLQDVLAVERAAFGQEEEAELVRVLLLDPSARPVYSLLAFQGEQAVGHILFTAATLAKSGQKVTAVILAPLAVVPSHQKQGVGAALVARGLELLDVSGVELVFVLGHPGYYSRFGFAPAGRLGFVPPYPVPEEYADAWMVRALRPGLIGAVNGTVTCAEAMNKPEYWR